MLYAKNSPVEALTPGMIFDVYNDDGTRCDPDTRPHYIVRQTLKFSEMRGLVRGYSWWGVGKVEPGPKLFFFDFDPDSTFCIC